MAEAYRYPSNTSYSNIKAGAKKRPLFLGHHETNHRSPRLANTLKSLKMERVICPPIDRTMREQKIS